MALLNTNTAGLRTPSHVAATISAGNVAFGTPQETLVFGGNETYQRQDPLSLFRARTGFTPDPKNLVVIDLPLIVRANETGQVKVFPGALGDALRQKGLRTGVLGNADLPGTPQRSMAVIAMDSRGIIDAGNTSTELLRSHQEGLLGFRTDYQALKTNFLSLQEETDFLVIDLGDLVRLEQNKDYLNNEVYLRERKLILQEFDQFLGWLLKNTDLRHSQVIVASLVPTPGALSAKRLFTFIGVLGEETSPGLLLSPTTRRAGIVTLYDIAPSILKYLGAPGFNTMGGRPWTVTPAVNNLEILKNLEARTVFISNLRPPLVKGYVLLHLIVLAGILLFLLFEPRKSKYLSPFLLALIAVPFVLLLMGSFTAFSTWLYMMLFFSFVAILVLGSVWLVRNKDLDPLLVLCLATVGLLLGDTLAGSMLQKNSVLGYDPMAGARFYGIGNEYMGVLLGATLMGVSLFVQRLRRISWGTFLLVGIIMLFIVSLVGAPQWGSNFGGTVAFLVAFSYTFSRFLQIPIRGREVVLIGIIVIVICSGLFILDYFRPPELRSHFGQLISALRTTGGTALWEVINRKLAMNYRLIKYTIWTRVLIGTLLALGILFYRPIGIFRRVLEKYPALAAGLEGSLLGALVALVFNDSGIVAAATALIFPAATLFFLVLREQASSF
ncbi:MAG: hypothetical protein QHH75_00570 [Bacillota bacterium]|nr:hypothetical protein [Bacillota bacterium]